MKFAGAAVETQERTTSNKSFKHKMTIGLLIAIAITSIAIAMIVGLGVGLIRIGSSSKQSRQIEVVGLTINSNSEWKLEGKYYGPAGGIHFLSTANESGFYLSITMINGEPVVTVKHPLDSYMTMMTLNSTSFLVMKNQLGQAKYIDYFIPKAYINLMESAMEKGRMSTELFQLLDSMTVNETRHLVLEGLAISQEGSLIIEAARALGESHVYGDDYCTAARFYLLALQLENIRNNRGQYGATADTPGLREKRASSNPWDNDVNGILVDPMTAWVCVVQDVHAGGFARTAVFINCYDHDSCCTDGYTTLSCAGVLRDIFSFPSVCSQHYSC